MWGRIQTSLSTPIKVTLSSLRPVLPSFPQPAPLSLQTNRLARQAPSSALLSTPDTNILATLVPATDDGPLIIDFRAKAAAVGVIPATWTRREQQPAVREILTARLIDRSLRPVVNPAHITVSVLAARKDSQFPIDALAVNAASAALAGAEQWPGPVAAARVAFIDGNFVPFPPDSINDNAELSVFVAINEHEKLLSMAVDRANDSIKEAVVLDAIAEGISAASRIIPIQKDFREQVLELRRREGRSSFPRRMPTREKGQPRVEQQVDEEDTKNVYDKAKVAYAQAFQQCRQFPGKAHRAYVVTETQDAIVRSFPDLPLETILSITNRAARDAYRETVFRDGVRMDGRRLDDVRPIRAETSVLPGDVHGSAIFERGDTQVLACSTIGLKRQAIRTEEYIDGGGNKPFFVHYSFPAYATGDSGRFAGPSNRREIGHSALTANAIEPLLNVPEKDYPYALRVSAEVMGSDGSSSMAAVCAGSLALMDAGAPLREAVAGVAMGLLSKTESSDKPSDDDSVILTDILGAEDHFGEMDMKVTGTMDGITACQLDTKLATGVSLAVVERTFEKAKAARLSILREMRTAGLDDPQEMPDNAPRAVTLPVNAFIAIQTMMKDRAAGLREVEAESGAKLTFDGQNQTMAIEAPNMQSLELARRLVSYKMNDLEIGTKLEATISEVKRSYAVIELSSGGTSGILHVSKMQINPSQHDSGDESSGIPGLRYPDARNMLSSGDTVEVVVLESDRSRNVLRCGLVSAPQKIPKKSLDEEIDAILEASKSKESL